MSEVKERLDELILDLEDAMKTAEPGTEEYGYLVRNMKDLYGLRLEEMKIESMDYSNTSQNSARKDQLKNEKIRFAVDIGKSILALGSTIFLANRILVIEEEGIVRSKAVPLVTNLLKFKN